MADKGLRVLVVDDEPAHIEAVRRAFAAAGGGATVRPAATLREYRERAAADPPDIALLDLILPDGCAVEALRAPAEANPFPILIMTIRGDEARAVQALKAGALDYIVKSAGAFADMPRAVERALREWDLLQARKRAEEAQRDSAAGLRALFEGVPLGVTLARDGRFLYGNPTFLRMTGFSREDLGAMTVFDQVAPESRDEARERRRRLMSGAAGGESYEAVGLRKDGTRFPYHITATGLQLSDGPAVLAFIADISESKRKEQKIEHLNRVLRAVRSVSQLITCEKDPARLIAKASQLMVEQRGYGWAMIILTDAAGKPREHAQAGGGQAFARMAESLRQGVLPPCCSEARSLAGIWRAKDRSRSCAPCPLAAHCAPFSSMCVALRHEGVLGYLAVAVDPAVEIDGEEQTLFIEVAGDVAFALHGIGQGIAMRESEQKSSALQGQVRQAQKMEVVGRLAGGVAHDFNNLLTAILGNCSFLMDGIPKDDARREDVEQICKAGQSAANLTRQLLAFSRKQVMQLKVLDLNAVLADMEKLLRRLIGEDISLTVVGAADLALVRADSGQMEQVIMNLAVNARDAMPAGGRLTIGTRSMESSSAQAISHDLAMPPGRYALLTVGDTGTGMDAGTLEHIFEPFFTTKELGRGTGLGLATVYGIVKQSGGFIDVQSKPGGGTTFTVYLPAAPDARIADEAEGADGPQDRGADERPVTILLVEDNEVVRRMASRILKASGYGVLEAGCAREALEQAGLDFDLVLTDIVLPDMPGLALVAKLQEAGSQVKVVYMSGYADNPDIRAVLSRPENRFLQKPFTSEALLRKVRQSLA